MKNNKGFTIVELMAVIVLLGLLSTIAVMSITRYKENAIESEKTSLRQNIVATFGMYRIDNGTSVDEEVKIKKFNATFTFNGKRCENISDDSVIKFVQESGTSKEIYCVRMYCNGIKVIDDSETNNNCNFIN